MTDHTRMEAIIEQKFLWATKRGTILIHWEVRITKKDRVCLDKHHKVALSSIEAKEGKPYARQGKAKSSLLDFTIPHMREN